jgi:hypothetical protein
MMTMISNVNTPAGFEFPTLRTYLPHGQDDQIRRFFANWLIVYFGQCFSIAEVAEIFGLNFSAVKVYVLTLTKNGLGYILGDFFTFSSRHPAHGIIFVCFEIYFRY